jgi:hypothetical protein
MRAHPCAQPADDPSLTHAPAAGHGDDALGGYQAEPRDGMAVYAIPRQAVVRQLRDSLVLHTTVSAARSRWLMHVALMKGAHDPRHLSAGPACVVPSRLAREASLTY